MTQHPNHPHEPRHATEPTDARATDDAGLSLVEVLISVFVGAVLLGLVATIFASTLQANAGTRDRDLATGRVQAISTSLTTSIRNAQAVTVQTVAGGGTVLRALVATGTSGWECRAWAVVDLETSDAAGRRAGADGRFELRMHTSAPLTGTATATAPERTWGVLADHVERTAPTSTPPTAPRPYFAASAGTVSWDLAVAVSVEPQLSDGSLAPVSGTAVARAQQTGGSARCW
jgi:Tfp pilus assembly protein PilV